MDRLGPTIVTASIIVLAFAGMLVGWRARVRRQFSLEVPDAVPDSMGDVVAVDAGLYVATTLAGDPLERVAVHGLGYRSRVMVTVTLDGIVVELTGRPPFFIARAAISGVQHGTWAIDKAVEPGGLVIVTWHLGETELDSYFRMDDSQEVLLKAVTDLMEGSA